MMEPQSRESADASTLEAKVGPAQIAYESVFESVSTLFRATGSIHHQLIGLKFRSGRALDAHIEIVKSPEKVPLLIERIRRRFGAVANVHLARKLPDNIPGLPHPERRTLVVIEVHGNDRLATAYCRVNQATREMTRGVLMYKDAASAATPGN